tara:strand:- start:358 stop:567 length:210 start_codon:yes stop_codon:yes gene_type:complete
MEFLHQIDNILTEEECLYYMNMFNDKELVEDIDDKHRKYHRVQFQDQEFADRLFEKVKGYLPKKKFRMG